MIRSAAEIIIIWERSITFCISYNVKYYSNIKNMLRTFDVMTVPKLNNKIKRYIKGPLTFLPQTEDDAIGIVYEVGVVYEIPYTSGNVYTQSVPKFSGLVQ